MDIMESIERGILTAQLDVARIENLLLSMGCKPKKLKDVEFNDNLDIEELIELVFERRAKSLKDVDRALEDLRKTCKGE